MFHATIYISGVLTVQAIRNVPDEQTDIAEQDECRENREYGPDRIDHAERGGENARHNSNGLHYISTV